MSFYGATLWRLARPELQLIETVFNKINVEFATFTTAAIEG